MAYPPLVQQLIQLLQKQVQRVLGQTVRIARLRLGAFAEWPALHAVFKTGAGDQTYISCTYYCDIHLLMVDCLFIDRPFGDVSDYRSG